MADKITESGLSFSHLHSWLSLACMQCFMKKTRGKNTIEGIVHVTVLSQFEVIVISFFFAKSEELCIGVSK